MASHGELLVKITVDVDLMPDPEGELQEDIHGKYVSNLANLETVQARITSECIALAPRGYNIGVQRIGTYAVS